MHQHGSHYGYKLCAVMYYFRSTIFIYSFVFEDSPKTDTLQGVSQSKIEGGGGDKRKSSIYNSLVDLNV